jgi:hypothetical protein
VIADVRQRCALGVCLALQMPCMLRPKAPSVACPDDYKRYKGLLGCSACDVPAVQASQHIEVTGHPTHHTRLAMDWGW